MTDSLDDDNLPDPEGDGELEDDAVRDAYEEGATPEGDDELDGLSPDALRAEFAKTVSTSRLVLVQISQHTDSKVDT